MLTFCCNFHLQKVVRCPLIIGEVGNLRPKANSYSSNQAPRGKNNMDESGKGHSNMTVTGICQCSGFKLVQLEDIMHGKVYRIVIVFGT